MTESAMGHEINEFLATHCTDVIDIANGVDWTGDWGSDRENKRD